MITAALFWSLSLSSSATPSVDEPAHDPSKHEWDFVVLPILSVNPDEGVGGGFVGAVHHYYGGVAPIRDDLSVRIFATSKLVQRHELRWEGREVLDLPLRLWLRLSLFSTVTQTYCGSLDCDPAFAETQARAHELVPDSKPYDDFTRHFYQMRYVRPAADTLWRWRVFDEPKLELMAGWRVAWYRPGDFMHEGPWPGSLYAKQFPHGEPGLSSVWQLGFTVDERDFEPDPSRGWFLESSVRGSHPAWGSTWKYAGVDTALSSYFPLRDDPRLVLANRALVDVLYGDVPTAEIAETGGTHDHAAFGGQWIGRGIRDRRVLGKRKVVDQIELRADLTKLRYGKLDVDVGAALFTDVGWIGGDTTVASGDLGRVVYGGGVGLRVLFQDAIMMRFDLAGSPFEQNFPSFYTPVGFPF